jgi:hypothetical protein
MSDIDHDAIERVLDTEDGLDPSALADLNKTETLVAILERLDVGYDAEELEETDRIPVGDLRRALTAVVGIMDEYEREEQT